MTDSRANTDGGAQIATNRSSPIAAAMYRPEIQGLRAIAATLVAVFHIWFDRASGAVDVFFVVSGFLIVGSLARRLERGHQVGLAATWSRIARRIVPAAYVVLAFSTLLVYLLVSFVYRGQLFDSLAAAALYVSNVHSAATSVDYNAQAYVQSPALHYWALSTQAHFYLVAPVLALACATIARHRRVSATALLHMCVLAITVASALYAIDLVGSDQQVAYFSTRARAWEFGIGALLAMNIGRISLPDVIGRWAAGLGLVAIFATPLAFDVGRSFPGPEALLPTMGAALVLTGSNLSPNGASARLLSSWPLQWVGSISYPLFLWHWPILVFVQYGSGGDPPSFGLGVLILAASAFLAWLTTRYVEAPIQNRSAKSTHPFSERLPPPLARRRGLSGYALAAVLPLGLVVVAVSSGGAAPDVQVADLELGATPRPTSDRVTTDLATAHDDRPAYRAEGCDSRMSHGPEAVHCTHGKVGGPLVVLAGGSHSGHWHPAFAPIADARGWELRTYTRDACRFADGYEDDCGDWNENVLAEVIEADPSMVIVTATSARRQVEEVPDGFISRWRTLESHGIPVLAIRDNPELPFDPVECVATHGALAIDCSAPRSLVLPMGANIESELPDLLDVHLLDLSDQFCEQDRCWAVRGESLIFRDNHMMSDFAEAFAPFVQEAMLRQVPDLLSAIESE